MTMMLAFGTSTPTSITVVDTRIESAPEANAAMTRSFSFAGEPAMHEADSVAEALAQLGVALLGRGDVEHLGFGHQRADPIDLRARRRWRAPIAADHLLQPLARHGAGRDRLPPRRLLVEARDVHVAIAREQQRAREWASRSSPAARRRVPLPFACKREPLMHAEAVLLVDHDKAEVAELDRLLEQRVGADQDVDASSRQARRGSPRARGPARGP